jgi:RNA polymerase sigma factor (TIGR02999 family)
MSVLPDSKVTALLRRLSDGDDEAKQQLLSLVYGDLYRRAERVMRKQAANHTLQPTALVNEAYIKLMGPEGAAFVDKNHFLAVAAQAMGQIVIDHARGKNRIKNAPPGRRVTLDGLVDSFEQNAVDLVALGDALDKLREAYPDLLELVEMRFFGGMTMAEIQSARDVSLRTCERDWHFARTWLKRKMLGDSTQNGEN